MSLRFATASLTTTNVTSRASFAFETSASRNSSVKSSSQKNYFHAVLEAVKGVAERVRQMSGLQSDGAELVNDAFGMKAPILAINQLVTDSEKSEQKGFSQLLIGLFGTVRNPLAHAPKIAWPMPEDDALDILTLVSFVHRKLDGATKI